jgi:hypothetical protein
MGDRPGHPFRGNQWTKGQRITVGGITATYNPNLTSEARNVGQGQYEVGPKFRELAPEHQAHVLKHEEGHDLSDETLRAGSAWKALDEGVLPSELNGQTTPGEIIAEAWALIHSEPGWVEKRHPALAEFVKREAKSLAWRKNPAKQVG